MVERMSYRGNYKSVPGETSDIFDGINYKELCAKYVMIDKEWLNHKIFSDQRDLALGFSTDGFQVCF
jgi:hypothetical protein